MNRNFEKLFPRVKEAEHEVVAYGSNHLKVEWRISAETFLNRKTDSHGAALYSSGLVSTVTVRTSRS